MNSYVLGISAFYHDSAAAILKDGEIIAAASEERFTRKKGDESFPKYAIDFCLDEAGIKVDDLEEIVFYDKPIQKFDRILASYIHRAPLGLESFIKAIPIWLRKKLWTEDEIRKKLKWVKPILFTDHHQSHAASAFYPSPFDSAAVLTVDGAGEWSTTTIGFGQGNQIKQLVRQKFPHSLGLLYSAFTYYCGFKVNSGEYKLMGLAPYGTPKYVDLIKDHLITIKEDGSFLIHQRYFNYISGLKMINRRFEKLFGRKAKKTDGPMDDFYMDVAASIQKVTEELLLKMAIHAKKLTGEKNLVMAGGVALNCVANGILMKEAGFENIWVQPAAGDAGGALGAALYYHYAYKENPRQALPDDGMKGSLLGPGYSDAEIQETLDRVGARYTKLTGDRLYAETVAHLEQEKVVGWFQGRMEFGPRALGNRSILGDARSTKMQSVMNLKIKFREGFRPFAPVVLSEKSSEIFDFPQDSPYMLMVAPVKKELQIPLDKPDAYGLELLHQKRSPYPAITHVDYSARLQTVDKTKNPTFRKLLETWESKTGSPVLVNTSFNVRGEPIVRTPWEAFRVFMGTDMDVLVLGSFVLKKVEQTADISLSDWRESWITD
jgi:carbamoyltransferase